MTGTRWHRPGCESMSGQQNDGKRVRVCAYGMRNTKGYKCGWGLLATKACIAGMGKRGAAALEGQPAAVNRQAGRRAVAPWGHHWMQHVQPLLNGWMSIRWLVLVHVVDVLQLAQPEAMRQ